MAVIKYANINMGADRRALAAQADAICQEYAARGLSLTLRQVYYQSGRPTGPPWGPRERP